MYKAATNHVKSTTGPASDPLNELSASTRRKKT
jgi:hypothetical protein